MREHDIDTLAHDDDKLDQAILTLLLHERSQDLWAVEELVREMEDRIAVEDALARLYGAGLIHRLEDGFVFATRAALRADQLAA